MNSYKYFLVSVLIGIAFISNAQTKTNIEKTSYEDADGKLYWNKDLPIYLNISSKPNEKGRQLKSKVHAQYTNPFYLDTEGLNYIRTRYAVDKDTHKTIYPKTEILFEIYADSKAPITKSVFKSAKEYKLGNKKYYGKNLDITLSAKDTGSGVKAIYYSINNEAFKVYNKAIMLNDNSEQYVLKYFAVDNVGNAENEQKHSVEFYIDKDAPNTYHNITGINLKESIIALNTKIYLDASDTKSGLKATYYKFDEGPFIPYNGNIIPLKQLTEDNHTLTYYSEDRVGNVEEAKSFKFFLDKSAPILTSDVLGDRFIVNNKIYFSGRTKLKLTAVDNKSGVKEVKYSIDGSDFGKYEQPFYLPKKPGFHIIKYYAIDNTENNTGVGGSNYKNYKYSTKKIYVDLVGPTLKHSFIGKRFNTRDTMFMGKTSKLKLSAFDTESGLQYISYSIDGEQKETMYNQPFSIKGNGKHMIEYFGYDNVNNRNISRLYVIVDENPPEPNCVFSVESYKTDNGLPVYPAYVQIYLSGIDKMTGTEKIFYSINGSIEKIYSTPIFGLKKGENTLKFKTVDKLGNEKYKEVKFKIE